MPHKTPAQKREYHRRYMRERWYPRNRERHKALTTRNKKTRAQIVRALVAANKSRCLRCGADHPAVLDFHHRDANQKSFSLSAAVSSGKRLALILAEIEKCDVLCANCHRIEHWDRKHGKPSAKDDPHERLLFE